MEETHKEDDVTQSRETRRDAETVSMSEPQSMPSSNEWEEVTTVVSESPQQSADFAEGSGIDASNLDACNEYTERVCAKASAEETQEDHNDTPPPAEV